MSIQFLRGNTAANDGYTGPIGSFSIDTEANRIRLHDGVTPGGHVFASIGDIGDTFDSSGNYPELRAGATTKEDVGLGQADNTSDDNKPVSKAQQDALDTKAPINNPTFTGTVTINEGEL